MLSADPLTSQKLKCRSGDLDCIVSLEKGLESQYLSRRYSGLEDARQLGPKGALLIPRGLPGIGKHERLDVPAGHSAQRRELPWLYQRDGGDRLCRYRPRQQRMRDRHSIEDHAMSLGQDLSPGHTHLVLVGIAKNVKQARNRRVFLTGPDNNGGRWRIDLIEQTAQHGGTRGGKGSHVLKRYRLNILGWLPLIHAARPAEVTLNERVHSRVGPSRHDDSPCVLRQLGHQKLECRSRLGIAFEDFVRPGEDNGTGVLKLEVATSNQCSQIGGRTGNCQHRSALHEARSPARARHREKLDSAESGKTENRLSQCNCALRVFGHDNELSAPGQRVNPLQWTGQESGNGVRGLGENVDHVLTSARRGFSIFRFQDFKLQGATWRSSAAADTVIIVREQGSPPGWKYSIFHSTTPTRARLWLALKTPL
jgi:hypothetical protein